MVWVWNLILVIDQFCFVVSLCQGSAFFSASLCGHASGRLTHATVSTIEDASQLA